MPAIQEPLIDQPPSASPDPWPLLRTWFAEADAHEGIRFAHAATLATVDELGRPDARIVLVHRLSASGVLISTDEESTKARQLASCPEAALVLYWGPLDRQVRLRGSVTLDDEASDRCFDERPRSSRITAWASRQSPAGDPRVLEPGSAGRRHLQAAWEEAAQRLGEVDPIPRPPHWRAFSLNAREIELWQARPNRLHDRLLFRRLSGDELGKKGQRAGGEALRGPGETTLGWSVSRLWP